ncbi:hypothetical protein N431DRAFT_494026 [Stipitochalara longipes BDJ]|nr:hypothetical protein N431DRAFT_494026 [Stipitochalara longipes BDJ]
MEQPQEPVVIAIPPARMELQSIEDFEAEMDAMDIVKETAAKSTTQLNPHHFPKKPKRTVDIDTLEAEKLARKEMGNEDWVSKLNDYRLAHPVAAPGAQPIGVPGLSYKEILLTSGILRFAFTVEIAECPQQFGGVDPSFSNKKDAKRYAAKKTIDWLSEHKYIQNPESSNSSSEAPGTIDAKALEAEKIAREEIGGENWYGRLIEYRNAHPVTAPSGAPPTGAPPGLDCKESILKFSGLLRFAYTIEIAESPQQFGGAAQTFSNKKDAKQYAAKKAIDWLIVNNHMPTDGSVRFPKPPPPVQVVQPQERKSLSLLDPGASLEGSIKYATLVPTLCGKLGFGPPRYEIEKAGNTAFWNGYAFFPGNPIIDGKVGEVFNVFGQKNAKEEIAEVVYRFLKDIERQREEQLDIKGRKRQRSSEPEDSE